MQIKIDRKNTCAISGHEPSNLPWKKNEGSSKYFFTDKTELFKYKVT